ncbi:MAG: PSD1 domain-containing protein [Planctomycetales bacterium]|nr:PSD1 domain-containing protein [Planctomycetales bacterium]
MKLASAAARFILCLLAITLAGWSAPRVSGAEVQVDFVREIKPLLARRCFACHGPETGEGGLRFDSREAALAELDSGSYAIVPGDVDASELLARVTADEDSGMQMPPEGDPLTTAEIDTLRRWIEQGADWRKHWAFLPMQDVAPPTSQQNQWGENPIDAFVLARLEAADLQPNPPADRRTLIRRAYFNLTGLPPTRQQVEAFVRNESPDAWEQLVEQLLASPHYGEQWARHWLDVVRFAETNSFERDAAKPNAWKYRDYVIRSLNNDKPYDQFVREQLAGDELDEVTEDSIIATGYYRLGIWDDEPADPEQALADEKDDLISTTGQAFLGLTLGCARCHDHKIDPIPQTDYYAMMAFFADVTSYGDRGDQTGNNQWLFDTDEDRRARQALDERAQRIERERTSMEEVGVKRMSATDQRRSETGERQALLEEKLQRYLNSSEWQLYQETLARLERVRRERNALPAVQTALALARCEPTPPATHVMVRGNPHVLGDVVEPHFPHLFEVPEPSIPAAASDARSAGRRRVLADWIASPDNMLTARVIVNRVWQHHFGRGIVRSANNFGELGDPPTHPELLDWLAQWLIDHNWQLKPLHRLIMTSQTYRMSSAGNSRALEADPTNDLLWRFDMRRLSAEEVRDAALAAAGVLNDRVYGPSFYPTLSEEVLATQSHPGDGWGDSSPEEEARRSVYIHRKRSLLEPLLTAFDFPDIDSSCEARFATTQPQQALAMLNSAFMNQQAERLALRVQTASDDPVAESIRVVLGREPTYEEVAAGTQLIDRLQTHYDRTADEALRQWCLVVLNLNEFMYLD